MTEKSIVKANRIKKEDHAAGIQTASEYNLMKKAKANPISKKYAIYGQCFNCMGGTIDEMPDAGWKRFIRECTALSCPL